MDFVEGGAMDSQRVLRDVVHPGRKYCRSTYDLWEPAWLITCILNPAISITLFREPRCSLMLERTVFDASMLRFRIFEHYPQDMYET